MNDRPAPLLILGAGLLVTLVVVTVAGLARVGGEEPVPTVAAVQTTVAISTTTTTVPVTPSSTTTVTLTSTTTTTLPAVEVTLTLEGAEEGLTAAVAALYLWTSSPEEAEPPPMASALAAHLAGAERIQMLQLTGQAGTGAIGEDSVAVAVIGDDVVLGVDDGAGWRIVGARLATFGKAAHYGPGMRMVMIIGSDARPGENQQRLRADSLHLATSVLAANAGAIVGFPRDSWVDTPYGGQDKFTHVMAGKGPEVVLETVRNLTGLPVEGYIVTGFRGFTGLIDAFGGVEVVIPFGMSDQASQAFFRAGLQLLNGPQALAFTRNRHIRGGDFTRSFHQGVFIHAGLGAVQGRGIVELPGLLEILLEHTWTDLDTESLLTLAAGAFELEPDLVTNMVLPGDVGRAGSKSVVFLGDEAEAVFRDLEDGLVAVAP